MGLKGLLLLQPLLATLALPCSPGGLRTSSRLSLPSPALWPGLWGLPWTLEHPSKGAYLSPPSLWYFLSSGSLSQTGAKEEVPGSAATPTVPSSGLLGCASLPRPGPTLPASLRTLGSSEGTPSSHTQGVMLVSLRLSLPQPVLRLI